MKTLFTIAKIIPRLDSENENEKTAAFKLIETKLRSDGIKWVDVGMRLAEFLTDIAGFEEKELEDKTKDSAKDDVSGWSQGSVNNPFPGGTASPTGRATGSAPPGWQSQGGSGAGGNATAGATTRRTAPPPPPPKGPDRRLQRGVSGQLAVVKDLLLLKNWTQSEQQNLLVFEQLLSTGLPLSKKQLNQLSEWSKKL